MYDMDFLIQLDKLHLRTQYIRITLLTFADEKPIKQIEGTITSGNVTVNSSSALRRTINFSMFADSKTSDIEDLDNDIALNKKIRVEAGIKNSLRSYEQYGDIIWFPLGLYVISSANVQRSTTGWNISVSGKDKMCLLDGTAGGTLPASTTFHEEWIVLDDEGNYEIQYPTIYKIIFEAVTHWGGEAAENIVISDLDEKIKMLVKYMGDKPVYFTTDYTALSFNEQDYLDGKFPIIKSYNEDAGYKETSFTYPGELVLAAGDTVKSLLDKIVQTLGNFEYFYDLDGRFIFQEIKNYLNTPSPLEETEITDGILTNGTIPLTKVAADNYVQSYNNGKFLYNLTELDTTTAITRTPKYDQIKNDFYAWGVKKTPAGVEVGIRYHLAIDSKPELVFATKYMWSKVRNGVTLMVDFSENDHDAPPSCALTTEEAEDQKQTGAKYVIEPICGPALEWREELYRRAVYAQYTNSVYDNYYDSELLAEWRKLYNPAEKDWQKYNNWNPDVYNNPSSLDYWLDFIDTGPLSKYSIKQIGRRTKVVNEDSLKSIYNKEVPDVVFLEEATSDEIAKFNSYGQRYFILTPEYYDLFQISSTGASCFDEIREMLYQNLSYNTNIQITCLPKYYMEVNNIIYIEDKDSHINGNYQVTQFTLPLTHNGTMSITATEVLTRV